MPSRQTTPAVPGPQRMAPTGSRHRWGWLEVAAFVSATALLAQLAAPWADRVWREWPRPGHYPQPGKLTAASLVADTPTGHSEDISYWVYLPEDYDRRQTWPLILYLHGSGCRGDNLDAILPYGPVGEIKRGRSLPCLVVAPQCRANKSLEPDLLLAFVNRLQQKFSVDHARVCVTGYSMGGYGAFSLASTAPDRFSAVVPVAGGGDTSAAQGLSSLPIWCFHGKHDSVVPCQRSIEMVDAIRSRGGTPRLELYAAEGHDLDRVVYQRDDVFDWMLAQRKL